MEIVGPQFNFCFEHKQNLHIFLFFTFFLICRCELCSASQDLLFNTHIVVVMKKIVNRHFVEAAILDLQ